jgi:hypothetical protein
MPDRHLRKYILVELHDRARTRRGRPRFVCQRQTTPASGFVVPPDRSSDSTGLELTGERSVTDPADSDSVHTVVSTETVKSIGQVSRQLPDL